MLLMAGSCYCLNCNLLSQGPKSLNNGDGGREGFIAGVLLCVDFAVGIAGTLRVGVAFPVPVGETEGLEDIVAVGALVSTDACNVVVAGIEVGRAVLVDTGIVANATVVLGTDTVVVLTGKLEVNETVGLAT